MDPTGLHNDPARPIGTIGNGGYLEMIDDYDGWAVVIEINQPNLPIPEHTVEFIDHSGSYGGGGSGGGSRSGSGSGNNDPKGASNNSHPGVDWDRIQEGFEAISEVGSWLEISGYVGAPFTEGATSAMSAVGEVFQNVGVFGSASIDVFVHGRYEKASIDISFHLLTGGLGHAIPGARESFRYAAGNIILSQF